MFSTLRTLLGGASGIALQIVSLLFILAMLAFAVVVVSYILKRRSGNADGLKQAGQMLWWSVFGLFVMVGVWGIVYFISSNLGIGVGGDAPRPSAIPGVNGVHYNSNYSGPSVGATGSGNGSGSVTNGSKREGQACTVRTGGCDNTECVSGYCCITSDGNSNPGDSGVCRKI